MANNGFDRTHSRNQSATVISKCDVFTLGSVETEMSTLQRVNKIYNTTLTVYTLLT